MTVHLLSASTDAPRAKQATAFGSSRAGHDNNAEAALLSPNASLRCYRFSEVSFDSTASLNAPTGERKNYNMSMNLYVGNLSFQTWSENINQLFAHAGTFDSVAVVEDRETGR